MPDDILKVLEKSEQKHSTPALKDSEGLDKTEQEKLQKVQNGPFSKVLLNVQNTKLEDEDRECPEVSEEEKEKKKKKKRKKFKEFIKSAGESLLDLGKELLEEYVPNIEEIIDSSVNLFKVFRDIGKKTMETMKLWEVKKEETGTTPQEDADVKNSIEAMQKPMLAAQDITKVGQERVEDGKKKADEKKKKIENEPKTKPHTRQKTLKNLNKVAQAIPVVGGIIKKTQELVKRGIKTYKDCKGIYQSVRNTRRLKKQETELRERLRRRHEKYVAGHGGTPFFSSSGYLDKKDQLHYGGETHLYEHTQWLREQNYEENNMSDRRYVRTLEDSLIVDELMRANKHRRNSGVYEVLTHDIGEILADALSLATPLGGLVGWGLKQVPKLLDAAKAGIKKLRDKAREKKWGNANSHQTAAEKRKRRHYLAVLNYDHLKSLSDRIHSHGADILIPGGISPGTKDPDEIQHVRSYLPKILREKTRVGAMGIDMEELSAAQTGADMVSIMSRGFYRESTE